MALSETAGGCPASKAYSQGQLNQAADELEALPQGSVLGVMVADYAVLRAKVGACQ